MTIRAKMLSLLLPILTTLIALIALFFYFNWSHEIINGFQNRLLSIVIPTANLINTQEVDWISKHLHEANLKNDPKYENYRLKLVALKQQLPIDNLYLFQVEPLKKNDISLLEKNSDKIREGHFHKEFTHKQVFLLDASRPDEFSVNKPGEIDFSESEENKIYFTKQAFVTPVYESRKTGERFMSAYAPILNEKGEVMGLLGADMNTNEIDNKLHNALLVVFISSLATLLLVIATVFMIANRISKPVQQLNQAALDIAAGNYEANIQVEGPQEIVELSNTFNTMSECLVENISRLRESSLARERMYGQYECGLLLQHYMLQKAVEDFNNPSLQMRLTAVNLSNIQKGLAIHYEYEKDNKKIFSLNLIEATQSGFEALYNLNKISFLPVQQLENCPFIHCQFESNYSIFTYQNQLLFPPLVWSIKKQQFIKRERHGIELSSQDMIFLYNSGMIAQFETQERIEAWFSKVLKHFAEDGLDTIHTMLTNELNFLAKRENLKGNFQILSLQVKI